MIAIGLRWHTLLNSVEYSRQAQEDLRLLRAYIRARVIDPIEQFLMSNPTAVGPVRIEQYKSIEPATYRLRVDNLRVIYRVDDAEQKVVVATVLPKIAAEIWTQEQQRRAKPNEESDDNGGPEPTPKLD